MEHTLNGLCKEGCGRQLASQTLCQEHLDRQIKHNRVYYRVAKQILPWLLEPLTRLVDEQRREYLRVLLDYCACRPYAYTYDANIQKLLNGEETV